jgi:hypothetical protein
MGANLAFADLRGADLRGADLSGAYNVSIKMLEEQAKSLRDATMPNGQKYENWLEGGKYIVDKFDPAFRFEAGKGWQLPSQTVDWVEVKYVPEGASPFGASPFVPSRGQLIFTSPLHVFDPSNLSELEKAPAPENADKWVSWFQRHPKLDTSKPVPVSVGGASGMRIDVTVASTPENYSRDYCEPQSSCVPLSPSVWSRYEEAKNRYIIVDEKGKTVVINVSAPADKFDEFLPKAQEVLDTVEWEGVQGSSIQEEGENSGPL